MDTHDLSISRFSIPTPNCRPGIFVHSMSDNARRPANGTALRNVGSAPRPLVYSQRLGAGPPVAWVDRSTTKRSQFADRCWREHLRPRLTLDLRERRLLA